MRICEERSKELTSLCSTTIAPLVLHSNSSLRSSAHPSLLGLSFTPRLVLLLDRGCSREDILASTMAPSNQNQAKPADDRKNSLYTLLGFIPPILSYKHQHAPKSNIPPSLELMKVFSYTSTLSSSSFLSQLELDWIKNYAKDMDSYTSYNMWVMKTAAELNQLSSYSNRIESRPLSPKIPASVFCQLLTETPSDVIPDVHLSNMLKSVFVLGCDEMDTLGNLKNSNATSSYALKVLNRQGDGNIEFNNSIPSLIGRTYKGYNSRMSVFVNIPTWIDACYFWQKRLDKEMELQVRRTAIRRKF